MAKVFDTHPKNLTSKFKMRKVKQVFLSVTFRDNVNLLNHEDLLTVNVSRKRQTKG
jgi:hypothetical protein